jgi:hypothetical protein
VRAQAVMPQRERGTALRHSVFGLGVVGGPATGLGLSFRHHLPSPFSYQIAGGIIKGNEKLFYDIGIEGQYDFARGPLTRFFACGGASYFYAGRSGHNEMEGPGRFGAGVGGELATSSNVNFSFALAFTFFSDGTVLPLPQFGLHYYFY